MSTATRPQSIDWATMHRADFDPAAPLTLVDAQAVARRVEAAPHANGTDALFGDEPTQPRATRTRRPAAVATPQDDALF
ncbi:hypothetical protein SAMN05216483_6687 [Streptomyces sp. 2131.1]|uniref:hypothetical protein n=1 Tax=Streptomyces sp. 2131.1 TaxID=1855346 RepID=UPI00089CAE01|nr:hypothetical protein [Streptomyces sp. 2131.1]SEE82933.1 hypothetical protein SAMN05216483_6687 [Streptomyces sp. 2131.1]